jgi:hypothetical protein
MSPANADESAAADPATRDGPQSATAGDRALLAAYWLWAALLLLATLAHLFGWDGVLDLLDVKRWFAR